VGNPENPTDIKDTEERRHAFYKAVSKLVRAYANIADEMEIAGYHESTQQRIKKEVEYFQQIKDEVMLSSNEKIDLKEYEPGMRQLIDFYLEAGHARQLSKLEDTTLLELIVENGASAIDELPENVKNNQGAIAETIENNIRKVIIEEKVTNPAYYERMSTLLDELIAQRKAQTQEYEAYLDKLVDLTRKVKKTEGSSTYPTSIDTNGKRALYDNLEQNKELSIALDEAIQYTKKDAWRDNNFKTKEVKLKIEEVLKKKGEVTPDEVERILDIVKNQPEY
jgi:type I restriction enzyme R subunit